MTIESLSTALLALTGPVTALMLALFMLRRRADGASSVWLAIWLIGLATRFGKSTLNALFGLEPWGLNIGLAGMLAAPAALYLSVRAAAESQQELRIKDLLHLAPACAFAVFAPWIPNTRGDPGSAYIYMCVLGAWAAYLLAARRWYARAGQAGEARKGLLGVALASTSLMGLVFALVFVWTPQLYLLNGVLFSLTVIVVAGLTIAAAGNARRARTIKAATPEQRALVERACATLREAETLGDINTNLARAARKLGVPQKTLSTAINQATGESFITLLNAARLEAAQRLMRETELSLEAIAARCGFSSASAFHRTFRRQLSATPAAWRAAERVAPPGA